MLCSWAAAAGRMAAARPAAAASVQQLLYGRRLPHAFVGRVAQQVHLAQHERNLTHNKMLLCQGRVG